MVSGGIERLKMRTLGPKSGGAGVAAVAGPTANAKRASGRLSFIVTLFGFAECLVFISFLKDEEGLFFHALVGDKALAVEVVLEAGVDAAGGAKVHQEPRAGATELGDLVQ